MSIHRFIQGIVWALVAAAALPLLHALLTTPLGSAQALTMAACLGVTVYVTCLCLCCGASLFFASALMFLPLAAALLEAPPAVVALQTGFCLAWIRSGHCFRGAPLSRLLVEVLLVGGGGLMALSLAPPNGAPAPWSREILAWGGVLWFFLLAQGVYLLPRGLPQRGAGQSAEDTFDQALRRAERLLE
jgi:hypothetical protein